MSTQHTAAAPLTPNNLQPIIQSFAVQTGCTAAAHHTLCAGSTAPSCVAHAAALTTAAPLAAPTRCSTAPTRRITIGLLQSANAPAAPAAGSQVSLHGCVMMLQSASVSACCSERGRLTPVPRAIRSSPTSATALGFARWTSSRYARLPLVASIACGLSERMRSSCGIGILCSFPITGVAPGFRGCFPATFIDIQSFVI